MLTIPDREQNWSKVVFGDIPDIALANSSECIGEFEIS
jgi:hypothetical protein